MGFNSGFKGLTKRKEDGCLWNVGCRLLHAIKFLFAAALPGPFRPHPPPNKDPSIGSKQTLDPKATRGISLFIYKMADLSIK